jgi:predicted transcriptional regulator
MKQVRVIPEPFYVRDLEEMTILKRNTLDLWVRALAEEGLIEAIDTSSPNRRGYLYKRVGAFACKSN